MKFFKVRFEFVAVVAADDVIDAGKIARSEKRGITSDDDGVLHVDPRPISSLIDLPEYWDGECIPYGGDGNSRLREFLP
jgi:hypothetical protein